MKILIVDDESSIIDMYKEKLTYDGFEVITATDGEDGLKEAQANKPDIILLDIIMPKMNGFDALKALKADSKTSDIPVYLLTNIPEDSSAAKGKELGSEGYLFKAETEPGQLSKIMKSFEAKLTPSKGDVK